MDAESVTSTSRNTKVNGPRHKATQDKLRRKTEFIKRKFAEYVLAGDDAQRVYRQIQREILDDCGMSK